MSVSNSMLSWDVTVLAFPTRAQVFPPQHDPSCALTPHVHKEEQARLRTRKLSTGLLLPDQVYTLHIKSAVCVPSATSG